jgi:hypothetical protein
VRGEDRSQLEAIEHRGQIGQRFLVTRHPLDRAAQRSAAGSPGLFQLAGAVQLLGDVRQRKERRERPGQHSRRRAVQPMQQVSELTFGLTDGNPGQLPYPSHEVEHVLTVRGDQRLPQQVAEQPDIGAQRGVALLGDHTGVCGDGVAGTGSSCSVSRVDRTGHGAILGSDRQCR